MAAYNQTYPASGTANPSQGLATSHDPFRATGATTTSTDNGTTGVTRKRTAQPDSFSAQASTVLNQAGGQANVALKTSKTHIQAFLDQHDLTPQNQLVWHACYAGVMAVGLWMLPSLVLKYNIPVAVLRGAFGIAGKERGHRFYSILFAALGGSSYALSGPLWPQARKSLEHIAVGRLAIAAIAIGLTIFLRMGSDALLLLGLGELAAGVVLIKTERLEYDNLVTVAKDGAAVAQGHAQVLAEQVQVQASAAQNAIQQSDLGAKIQAHPITQKIVGAPAHPEPATSAAPQPL